MKIMNLGILTLLLSTSIFATTPMPEKYKMDCDVKILKTTLDQELFIEVYKDGFNKRQTIFVNKRHYNGNSFNFENITEMSFKTDLSGDYQTEYKVKVYLTGVPDREIGGMQVVGGFSDQLIQSATLSKCDNYQVIE